MRKIYDFQVIQAYETGKLQTCSLSEVPGHNGVGYCVMQFSRKILYNLI